jgi:hypothetical protein
LLKLVKVGEEVGEVAEKGRDNEDHMSKRDHLESGSRLGRERGSDERAAAFMTSPTSPATLGGIGGLAAGAVAGMIAGPAGLLVGALLGSAIGAAAGAAVGAESKERQLVEAELDRADGPNVIRYANERCS